MESYQAFYRRSIDQRDAFWGEQAGLIDWHTPPREVCDFSRPPFVKWFVGGATNLCHNAVDRHAAERPDARALIYVSTETGIEQIFSFAELQQEVMRMAAVLQSLGVTQGERVLVYLPMIPEAVFAMLACARIGAIHSVVFGGFAAHSLASRIDDARPCLIISADAGMRGGKAVPYKHLLDEACRIAKAPPQKVLMVERGIDPDWRRVEGRDLCYAPLRAAHMDAAPPCVWLESSAPSYILYTSGTTGQPKGVQRDTGGYAVALAASMKYIYTGGKGETMFSTSDIGWVVGHSYIIYGPLIAGMATILYEGTPVRPDAGIWWRLVEQYKVKVMFSAPTAIRVLKKQDPDWLTRYDLSSLKHLFLAGEPLDQPTHAWISEALGLPVIDNYWQTETGWPVLSDLPGVAPRPVRHGTPGQPVYGFDVRIYREDGSECAAGEKGIVAIVPPLPPGCLSTVWGDDARFERTYFSLFKTPQVYSSFDYGIRNAEGDHFILGRSDDVINVAGHRLGTREIEEALAGHPSVAEVAVVGVHCELKGQEPLAFVVLRDASQAAGTEQGKALEQELKLRVDQILGPIGRPAQVHFVGGLPKTRSGKLLRRMIQAMAEGREAGDTSTIDDVAPLAQIAQALGRA